MDNNYYIPDITDFYVGYQCEYNLARHYIPITFKCLKEYIKNSFTFEEVFKMNEIRTKYLDKEDIESLGFNQEESLINKALVFIKDNIVISYLPEIHVVVINKRDKEFPRMPASCLFQGEIKSINELKKVLQYLKIE